MIVREIADGVITVEMQPTEAMDLARACEAALSYEKGTLGKTTYIETHYRRFETYTALFEALAVAGHCHYSIANKEEAAASLSSLRAVTA